MAGNAQSNAVIRVVAPGFIEYPCDGVMNVELAAALAAIQAREVVSFEHTVAVGDVGRVMEVGITQGAAAAFPERVRRANEMRVSRGLDAGPHNATSDGRPMFIRQRASSQGGADVVPLRLRDHAPGGRRPPLTRSADLGTSGGGLCWIADVRIDPAGSTRAGAEPLAPRGRAVLDAALVTDPSHFKANLT